MRSGAGHVTAFHARLGGTSRVTIAGIGDSLTYGWMVSEGFFDRVVSRLRQHPNPHDISAINAGIPGDTAAGGLSRIAELLERRPDMVTIQFGLNDMYRGIPEDDFEHQIAAMTERVLSVSSIPVLMTSCPLNWPEGQETATRFYERIRRVSKLLDVPCADVDRYWRENAGPPDAWNGLVQSDDVHPTDDGHALMAEAVLDELDG